MKNLVFLAVLAVAAVGGVGIWRGWFAIGSDNSASDKANVTLTVDKEKIAADKEAAIAKVQAMRGHAATTESAH